MEKIVLLLAKELNIKPAQAEAALQLLDDGNTVPFIARYRKEATGSLDEEQIRNVETRAQYLRNLDARREEILNSIREQEKLTPELEQQIMAAEKMQVLEDLYLPYRPKKRTRAQIAREKGLEPLASYIVLQADTPKSLAELAAPFINAEKGVEAESDEEEASATETEASVGISEDETSEAKQGSEAEQGDKTDEEDILIVIESEAASEEILSDEDPVLEKESEVSLLKEETETESTEEEHDTNDPDSTLTDSIQEN